MAFPRAASMNVKSTTTSTTPPRDPGSATIATPSTVSPAWAGSIAAASSRSGSDATAPHTVAPIRPPAPNTPTRIMARNVLGCLKVLRPFADNHSVGDLGQMMPANSRQPVTFDRASMRLAIGDKCTLVPDPAAGNEAMLRSYLALVADVRGTPIGSGIEVRHDDVVVLAEILDLTDADLDVHLANLLGVSAKDAADVHRRIRRHVAFAATFAAALGSIGIVGAANVSAAGPA